MFILSLLCHAGILLGLSPLLFVVGRGSEPRPAVFLSDVVQLATPEQDRAEVDAPPPTEAAELPPELIDEQVSDRVEPPPFEPLREVRPLTAQIRIPANRSVLARPKKESPPPPRAETPPPARAAAPPVTTVSIRRPAPRGPSRKAAPLSGNAKPRYPSRAMNSGIEGLTLLVVSVGLDGSILDVRVKQSSGSVLLDREAVRAVKSWNFRPALKLGRPVASKVAVPIRFKLR